MMIWRTLFVAALLTVLATACSPRTRFECEPVRVKNKSLGLTGSTVYDTFPPQALSC